ncbi:hypothetical protein RB195_026129 [Necator americanus]|uniref:Uncharacterized protein n=1 Tax=Necator americanus TaxID=51031 RepID=A0ABR1EVG9_NECAM
MFKYPGKRDIVGSKTDTRKVNETDPVSWICMRRAAGVHMCASRHKISALSSQEGRKLPPSLKAEYRREYEKEIKASRSTQDTTPPTPIHPIVRYKKRRSIYKDESPRSGLRPSHTLEGTRSRSDYGIVSQMQRMEEQRKLSDYGLLPPVVLPCVQISSVSLPSRSSTPSRFQRGRHSWKERRLINVDNSVAFARVKIMPIGGNPRNFCKNRDSQLLSL